jgi:hypothetical protein
MSDLEGQTWSVRVSDVDALAIADVYHRRAATAEEHPVGRIVVNRNPLAAVKAEQQVRAGDEGMRNAHIGAEIASNDHVMTCRETTLRPVRLNRQYGRCRPTHQTSIGCGANQRWQIRCISGWPSLPRSARCCFSV